MKPWLFEGLQGLEVGKRDVFQSLQGQNQGDRALQPGRWGSEPTSKRVQMIGGSTLPLVQCLERLKRCATHATIFATILFHHPVTVGEFCRLSGRRPSSSAVAADLRRDMDKREQDPHCIDIWRILHAFAPLARACLRGSGGSCTSWRGS